MELQDLNNFIETTKAALKKQRHQLDNHKSTKKNVDLTGLENFNGGALAKLRIEPTNSGSKIVNQTIACEDYMKFKPIRERSKSEFKSFKYIHWPDHKDQVHKLDSYVKYDRRSLNDDIPIVQAASSFDYYEVRKSRLRSTQQPPLSRLQLENQNDNQSINSQTHKSVITLEFDEKNHSTPAPAFLEEQNFHPQPHRVSRKKQKKVSKFESKSTLLPHLTQFTQYTSNSSVPLATSISELDFTSSSSITAPGTNGNSFALRLPHLNRKERRQKFDYYSFKELNNRNASRLLGEIRMNKVKPADFLKKYVEKKVGYKEAF